MNALAASGLIPSTPSHSDGRPGIIQNLARTYLAIGVKATFWADKKRKIMLEGTDKAITIVVTANASSPLWVRNVMMEALRGLGTAVTIAGDWVESKDDGVFAVTLNECQATTMTSIKLALFNATGQFGFVPAYNEKCTGGHLYFFQMPVRM